MPVSLFWEILSRYSRSWGKDISIFLFLYQSLKTNGLAIVEFVHDLINLYKTREALRTDYEEMTDYLVKMNNKKLLLEK
jgi:hypothetical protein